MKRLLVVVAVLAVGAAPQTGGTIRRHPSNPRYFEFRGRPTGLITSGEH